MAELLVFVGVFAAAGAFYFWLRRLGRKMAQRAATDSNPDNGEEMAENLGFAADVVSGLAKRRSARRDDQGGDGESGGDGGGGDGG